MKRVLFSLAALASLLSAGCCCDNWCNWCNPCGSTCHRPCASPSSSPCGGNACGYGPTSYAAPVMGTASAGVPVGSEYATTAGVGGYGGPVQHTAAMMPAESLPTY